MARRKLLPGLLHLSRAGLLPECIVVGTALDDIDTYDFRRVARAACDEYARSAVSLSQWAEFEEKLRFVPQSSGPKALAEAVFDAEKVLGPETKRLHYLSVPPSAARAVVRTLADAEL